MAEGAYGVAGQDTVAECLVSACVVAALGCRAPCLVPLPPMGGASAALGGGVQGRASGDAANAHG